MHIPKIFADRQKDPGQDDARTPGENRSRAPRSRHSWHADMLLDFHDEPEHGTPMRHSSQYLPPPRLRRQSFDMLSNRFGDKVSLPALSRFQLDSDRREIVGDHRRTDIPSASHGAPTPRAGPPPPRTYRQALEESHMNLNFEPQPDSFLDAGLAITPPKMKAPTSSGLSVSAQTGNIPGQHRRKPVPPFVTPPFPADTPLPGGDPLEEPFSQSSPVRMWEPLNVSAHVSPARKDRTLSTSNVTNILQTPPTPYFSPLNDVSPAPSLSSEAWRNDSPPSPSLAGAQLEPEFQDSFELGQARLFDDVLASWGLPVTSDDLKNHEESRSRFGEGYGTRMTRSQSIPLDLRTFQLPAIPPIRALTPQAHLSQPHPALSASTSRLLSDRTTIHDAQVAQARSNPPLQTHESKARRANSKMEKKQVQPGPRFYPSGRSFATIRAASPSFSAPISEDELPFVGARRPLKGKLQGRVKTVVARFEASGTDSPTTPTRSLQEIGQILNHQSSVSSLNLGSGTRRMMAEARLKKLRSK
ncbi:hypothetical protein I316_00535 [Kwoniella heveanensis BCC8398]|uniref:Uncharacterized protein n=1 Tax=Kwoniella heveanensis BCC8398 TaxID=1296120 RepID=A0A1B9H2B3_9TREE|nr:hypothetical protein I316_00535 [Kwoniella heveanensis BCC8398]